MASHSARLSAGGFSQNVGFLGLRGGDRVLPVRMRRADDDDGIDVRVADEFVCRGVCFRHIEFFSHAGGERAIDVCHCDDRGFGNARGQVADVHLAEPSSANHTDFELRHK